MILQGLFNKPPSSAISTLFTVTSAKGNTNVTLISGNDFIKAHYNDSNAFALVYRITNIDDSNGGVYFQINTNKTFAYIDSGQTQPISGIWAYRKTYTTSGSPSRIYTPLNQTSTSTGSLYATSTGNLISKPCGNTQALREGQYFVIFGLMERSNMD